jgi:molybdenum cofactor synthesis domain-containing protein
VSAIRIAIVTISDGVANGTRQDTSGPAIAAWAQARAHEVVDQVVVPDEKATITSALMRIADLEAADVVLTTGGTGLTERDVTPEATLSAIQRNAPGIAEALRAAGSANTPFAWLSRGVAGTRGRTLIINLPGSESGVRDGLQLLDRILSHAVQLLRGVDTGNHSNA